MIIKGLQAYSRVQFGTDNATVTLELAANRSNQETAGVSYNISVVPRVDLMFINSTVVQLRVIYNVEYNISIMRTLCGQYTITTPLKLSYGESCTYIIFLSRAHYKLLI